MTAERRPPRERPWRAVGLMIGTSLDGVDAARIEIPGSGELASLRLVDHRTVPLRHSSTDRLRAIASGSTTTASELSALRFSLSRDHEEAVRAVTPPEEVAGLDWVGVHGVTLCHEPSAPEGHGWQLNAGPVLAAWLGCPVVDDFRLADIALGGEGAPLAPVVDRLLRGSAEEDRAVLNLGGIANLTALPAGASSGAVYAGDVGPANLPLDGLWRRSPDRGTQGFDRDGAHALSGVADPDVVSAVLAEDWVRRPLPRSFGREEFGEAWLDRFLARATDASEADRLATLVAIEAQAVRIFLEELCGSWRARPDVPLRLLVTGGGRHNRAVMEALARELPEARVESIDVLGVDGDAKEAVDFGVLGALAWWGRCAPASSVTGARRDAILGSIHLPPPTP